MKTKFIISVVLLSFFGISAADDTFSKCPEHYASKSMPSHTKTDVIEICYDNFVVGYSLKNKSPLWSAEKLTKVSLDASDSVSRTNRFHQETAIPAPYRSKVSDYLNSGYDRGHLTPDKDFPVSSDTDSLANIVPQVPSLNRGSWAILEEAVRGWAVYADTYVITGAIYDANPKLIGSGTPVPTHLYKVVKNARMTKAYIVKNEKGESPMEIPLDVLSAMSGLKF